MKDKETETKLRLIELQLESWKQLHDLITYGLDKAKSIISVDQERQFTEVRANLLQETEYVLRELNLLGDLSGRAVNVLNRGTSLRTVRELSNDDARRLETDWNGVFTKLGVAQGQLKSRRKAFAEVTPFKAFKSRLFRRPAVAQIYRGKSGALCQALNSNQGLAAAGGFYKRRACCERPAALLVARDDKSVKFFWLYPRKFKRQGDLFVI